MNKPTSNRKVGHTSAPRGKRVQVVLRDGSTFVDRFKEKESGYIYFYDHKKVKQNLVYQLRILPPGFNPKEGAE